MTTPLRLCQRKHCGEPAEDQPTPEGEYLCPDHRADWEIEQELFAEGDSDFTNEHPFLRVVRAM